MQLIALFIKNILFAINLHLSELHHSPLWTLSYYERCLKR